MRISDWSSDVCSSDLLEVADSVDIDALEELGGVGPLHLDLAEGRGVEQPDLSAQREHLARDRRMFVFTGTGEIGGSQPQAVIFHPGACRDRRCMGGGMGERHQILADRTPRDTADRHGVERSEEQTSELQSLMRTSYALFRLKKTTQNIA